VKKWALAVASYMGALARQCFDWGHSKDCSWARQYN